MHTDSTTEAVWDGEKDYITGHPKILAVAWWQAAQFLRGNAGWERWASGNPDRAVRGYLPDWAIHDPTERPSAADWNIAWKLWEAYEGEVNLVVIPVAGSYRLNVTADVVRLAEAGRAALKAASGGLYAWGAVEISDLQDDYTLSLDGEDVEVKVRGTGAHVGGAVWANVPLPEGVWSHPARTVADVARWVHYHRKGYDTRTNARKFRRDGRVVIIPPDPINLAFAVQDGYQVRAGLADLGRTNMPRMAFDVHRIINTSFTSSRTSLATSTPAEDKHDQRECHPAAGRVPGDEPRRSSRTWTQMMTLRLKSRRGRQSVRGGVQGGPILNRARRRALLRRSVATPHRAGQGLGGRQDVVHPGLAQPLHQQRTRTFEVGPLLHVHENALEGVLEGVQRVHPPVLGGDSAVHQPGVEGDAAHVAQGERQRLGDPGYEDVPGVGVRVGQRRQGVEDFLRWGGVAGQVRTGHNGLGNTAGVNGGP